MAIQLEGTRMNNGTDPSFFHPHSMQHWDDPILTNIPIVDDFNELIIRAFNVGSGNILLKGQKVAWNVWADEPSQGHRYKGMARSCRQMV